MAMESSDERQKTMDERRRLSAPRSRPTVRMAEAMRSLDLDYLPLQAFS